MKKLIYIYIILLIIFSKKDSFSQVKKICDSNKDTNIYDLNDVVTKCKHDKKKTKITSINSRKINFKTFTRKRKRKIRRKNVSYTSNINLNNKLEKIKKSYSLVKKLNLSNNKIIEKLPYHFIENKPYFSKCKKLESEDQSKCFKEEVQKYVKINFNYPTKSYQKNIQGKVFIRFLIDENGNIKEIRAKGPNKELEDEAIRIVRKLPKLNPGKMNGNPIKVTYDFSILFKVNGVKPSEIKVKKKNLNLDDIVNFKNVQNIPLFRTCVKKRDKKSKLNCFNNQMKKHIQKYFNYPEQAYKNKIEGKVISYFIIDKEGDVVNIKNRYPKNAKVLSIATEKIINELPKFIPGNENGKRVNVMYSLPITYKINN